MKILFISEHYKHNVQGGGEINLYLLCEALVGQGHDVHVLTSYNERKCIQDMYGVKVYCTINTGVVDSFLGNLKRSFVFPRSAINESKKLLHKQNFDVIHFIGSAIQLAPQIMRMTSIPLVATVESFLSLCPKGDFVCGNRVDIRLWGFWMYVLCLLSSDEIGKMKNNWYLCYNPVFWIFSYRRYVGMRKGLAAVHPITISKFMQCLMQSFYGIESVVVPNFIDLDFFRAKKREESGETTVLYLGSLTKYKGADVLLRAARGLDCRLKLYGEGTLKENLKKLIKMNNLDARIYDPIPYNQVPQVYADADIVVFPSLWPEPFGRIAIEAMAAGKPVIGSDIGGISDTLQGVGRVVEPGNVKQLHLALRELLGDAALRRRVGREAKKRALIYSKKKVLKQLVGVYKEVMSKSVHE